jgi:molecular chaperone GrpE
MTESPSPPDLPGADPTPTPESARVPGEGHLLGLLESIAERLARLESRFDDKIKNDAAREAIVQRLHTEVQDYRTDLLLKVLRPVLLDLISLYDEMGQALASPGPEDSGSRERLLAGFQQEVADILYRQGVEPFAHEGEQFDPRRQRASRTLPAPAPEREGQIAARLRPGFAAGERVLRPELVAVYVRAGGTNSPLPAPKTADEPDPSTTGDPRA